MKKFIFLFTAFIIFSCSTGVKQTDVVRDLAVQDLKTQLQLPEETKFNTKEVEIHETETDLEGIGSRYEVKFSVKSQDELGKEIVTNYKLTYVKISEGGLSPNDYELVSFD